MTTLDAPIRAQAKALLGERAHLRERIAQADTRTVDAVKTRYHGDLHLGQVLLTADDFIIIDFEGEPGRPLEERRRKHSPLRDVAGMLRSFDYARAVALDKAVAGRPDMREQVSSAFESWLHSCSRVFMDGYRAGVGDAPCWPTAESDALIGLFQIEKATYELRYELDHRPAWVGVPISGLLALARGR
jgi:maltose alpha-D-glucosyltransferase/alpha-amylase